MMKGLNMIYKKETLWLPQKLVGGNEAAHIPVQCMTFLSTVWINLCMVTVHASYIMKEPAKFYGSLIGHMG